MQKVRLEDINTTLFAEKLIDSLKFLEYALNVIRLKCIQKMALKFFKRQEQ